MVTLVSCVFLDDPEISEMAGADPFEDEMRIHAVKRHI